LPSPPPRDTRSLHDALPIFGRLEGGGHRGVRRGGGDGGGDRGDARHGRTRDRGEDGGGGDPAVRRRADHRRGGDGRAGDRRGVADRKSTRLNSSHQIISYAV